MRLIIGGAYQGKLAYATERFSIQEWVDGRECDYDEIFTCQGIYHFHEFVRRALKESKMPDGLVERLAAENSDIVIVTNELGYGIVPMDAFDREYRETTGRLCSLLAQRSAEVYRVVCGIGMEIKHA